MGWGVGGSVWHVWGENKNAYWVLVRIGKGRERCAQGFGGET